MAQRNWESKNIRINDVGYLISLMSFSVIYLEDNISFYTNRVESGSRRKPLNYKLDKQVRLRLRIQALAL